MRAVRKRRWVTLQCERAGFPQFHSSQTTWKDTRVKKSDTVYYLSL